MDRSALEIEFDENGVCNFCKQAQKALEEIKPLQNELARWTLVRDIHRTRRGDTGYDCLIGLSGGADSSYMLTLAVKYGLKPLCFSVDNGWNDPAADENIMRLVEGLKVPFMKIAIDRTKFGELQGAFLQAGLINVEIPTDHVLMAVSYELAEKYLIKYILSGGNVATESIMPPSWGYNARDLTHIQDVYTKVTGKKLTGLPTCSIWKWNYYRWIKGIKTVYWLDYFEYDRASAIAYLEERFGYKNYGEKHEESTFTKWFQNFYLFEKYAIDKRKAHYSSMINSGQMTRKDALDRLTASPIYPMLGIENRVFAYPKRAHDEFAKDKWYPRIASFVKLWK